MKTQKNIATRLANSAKLLFSAILRVKRRWSP